MIAHSLPGRLRIRHPDLRGPALLARVEKALRAAPGVEEVEASPDVGSILVRFSAPFGEEAALALLRKHKLSEKKRNAPVARKWHKLVKAGMGSFLGASMVLVAAGRERAHVATGMGFLAFLLFHAGLNRKRLTL